MPLDNAASEKPCLLSLLDKDHFIFHSHMKSAISFESTPEKILRCKIVAVWLLLII